MKRTFLADSITFFFILLFLYTGTMKLMEIHTFRQQLSSSPLMASLSGIITWALPFGEILLAAALIIPKWRLLGLYCTLMLMTLFATYVVIILALDDQLTCSCGGVIEQLTPKQHVLFNSSCVILSLVGILVIRRQQATPLFTWLTGSSAIGLFAVVGWLLFTAFTAPATPKSGLEGRMMPSLDLLLPDSSTHFNTGNIPVGKPFIVMGFSPWCTHCQALTSDLTHRIKEFKDTRIYYITPENFAHMRTFYRYFKLSKYPNIIIGRDSANTFFTYFNAHGTPYIGFFDAKKRLRSVLFTQPTVDLLLKGIQD